MEVNDNNIHKNRYINLFIILAYFAYLFLNSMISGMIGLNHQEKTKDWLQDSVTYEWIEADDGFTVNYQANISNQTNGLINETRLRFRVLDENDELIGFEIIQIKDLEAYETRVLEGSFNVKDRGDVLKIDVYVPFNTQLANTIQMLFSLMIAIVLIIINRSNFKDDFIAFKKEPKSYFSHIATGFILVYISAIVANVILTFVGVTETSQNEMAIQSMFNPHWISVVTLFLTLVILTPMVEEVVFRKGLYNIVRPRFGDVGAILVSGLVFGFLHVASWGDFIQVIPYALMGLSFSFIYYYSNRNIYVVIAIHALNNLIPYLIYTTDILS